MSDTIKTIREAIEGKIDIVATGYTKLDNKFDLKKNNFNNQLERYGVIATSGSTAGATLLRHITIDRDFEITLCNQFISTMNADTKQQEKSDSMENAMEAIIDELESSKAGLPNLVNKINFASNDPITYDEIENLSILRFTMTVQYRKLVSNNC